MTYVITEPCINVKDASCLDVSVCPVRAIFPEDAVPDKWTNYTELNKNYFNK